MLNRAQLPRAVVRRSAYAILATLWITAACGDRTDSGLSRFQQATLSPCPIFSDDILRWEGLPACPFPSFVDIERPCAIEYYLEGDSEPRARRSLRFDKAGRLAAFSDRLNGKIVESRRIYYESEGDTWVSHHYAKLCSDPAPRFLYTLQETWDKQERPIDISSGPFHWQISYDFERHLLFDTAQVRVQEGAQRPYMLELDPGGHVVGKRGDHESDTTHITLRNGFISEARWVNATGEEIARAHYAYDGHRLQALRMEYPTSPVQTYRFVYACNDEPTCALGRPTDQAVTALSPTVFSRDPKLASFVPRNCSDQLAQGPHICGQVFTGAQGLAARCCQGDDSGISFAIRNQFSGPRVVILTLKTADGRELTTDVCRYDEHLSVCRIKRDDLMSLPDGKVTIEMTTKSGQPIHILAADAEDLRRAAE